MTTKPPKPYPTFPLAAHIRGYWFKKIHGRQITFGRWAWPNQQDYERSWKSALDRLKRHEEQEAIAARVGMRPDELTVGTLVNFFLSHKHDQAQAGAIAPRMFYEYRLVLAGPAPDADGKKPEAETPCFRDSIGANVRLQDLERDPARIRAYIADMDGRLGFHSFNRRMTMCRSMFKYAACPMNGVLDRPFRYAGIFEKRPEKFLRREKREREDVEGKKLIPPAELAAMVRFAPQPLRAMLLLGYFCAYGGSDCADLPISRINFNPEPGLGLGDGWATIHFPRPKTEVDRAAVIPPLVARSVLEAIAGRPEKCVDPKWASLAFRTVKGFSFVRDVVHRDQDGSIVRVTSIDAVADSFAELRHRMTACPGRLAYALDAGEAWCACCRKPFEPLSRRGFYQLRHSAITAASGAADVDLLSRWQGHILPGMRRHYVEEVEASRLRTIAVRLLERFTAGELTGTP